MAKLPYYDLPEPRARGISQIIGLLIAVMVITIGCDSLPGNLEGEITENIKPIVEFANVPAENDTFSFAPVIYWKGRDPDGFVEYYDYADIIDATALNDPIYYIDFIPEESWVRTEATSDTVYLLTEAGEVTEHVFYVKCTDDRDAESDVIYRRFNRTNDPPRVPEIKWFTEADFTFDHDIPHPDSTGQILLDTLYSLDRIIEGTWPGLGFNWKSSDPDDSELFLIPLQFKWYLEKVPHDTIWEWVAPEWSPNQELRFFGLETGHYTFTVWARDDGFETSQRPASASFDVYQPTFDQSILLLNTTDMEVEPSILTWDIPGAPIAELYREAASIYPDVEYLEYTGGSALHKAFLGRFRLVIWFSENQSTSADDPLSMERDLVNYINVGGRLWVMGLMTRQNMIANLTTQMAQSSFAGPPAGANIPNNEAELSKVISGVSDLPDLTLDTSRTGAMFRESFTNPRDPTDFLFGVYPLLPGVDIFTTGLGAETAYYFSSYTDTTSGDVTGELAEIIATADTIYYPPTATECIIVLERNRVSEVTRIENITRGVMGTPVSRTNNILVRRPRCVVRVSYENGEPWALSDSVIVDYQYLPFSDLHLKPCAIRYERVTEAAVGGYEVLYRVAIFSFPIYYFDNRMNSVTIMFRSMLNWFFLPYAH